MITYRKIIFLIGTLLAVAMFSMACLAFYIGFINYNKLQSIKRLILLPAAEIAFCIALLFGPLFFETNQNQLQTSLINYKDFTFYCSETFNIIEFLIVMNFITNILSNVTYKRLARTLTLLGSLSIILLSLTSEKESIATYNYAAASLIIIVGLTVYFKERVDSNDYIDFQEDPLFIIASGCFIQFCLTFPSSILVHELLYNEQKISDIITIVNYTAYTFYFYFIYIGFQCQIEKTK